MNTTTHPQWELSDNGAGGAWDTGDDFIQFNIADDVKCKGSANEVQTGTAIINFNTDSVKTIVLRMTGKAESKYEEFSFYIDDKRIVRVLASDDDYCQVHTCKMCNVSMAPQEVSLPKGDHTLRIEISTIDHKYHLNAYFRIEFSIKQADVCKSCECPSPTKPTEVQRPPRPTEVQRPPRPTPTSRPTATCIFIHIKFHKLHNFVENIEIVCANRNHILNKILRFRWHLQGK